MKACGPRDNPPISDFVLLMVDGREYRIAYAAGNGKWDIVDRFMALDDDSANAHARTYYYGDEYCVLDQTGRDINAGDQE